MGTTRGSPRRGRWLRLKIAADDIFGPKAKAARQAFQRCAQIGVNSIVGVNS